MNISMLRRAQRNRMRVSKVPYINKDGIEGLSDSGKILKGYRWIDKKIVRAGTWANHYDQ